MRDDEFEWNEAKARRNFRDHHVSFNQAKLVFQNVFVIEFPDDRHGYDEDRFNVIGHAGGILVIVTYTMRGHRKRIISARRASSREADLFFRRDQI